VCAPPWRRKIRSVNFPRAAKVPANPLESPRFLRMPFQVASRVSPRLARSACFLLALSFAGFPVLVAAQTGNADAGSTLWSAFRSVLYGPWGLVGSAIVVALGIYMFLERGFMHALGVMAAGALIFFVPLIVISMRNTAQALGGAG
jgi:hypothetical protein